MSQEDLYKHACGLYYHEPHYWQKQKYGDAAGPKWDIISITCHKIIDDKDTSPWAKKALIQCKNLLRDGYRWPEGFNHTNDSKNRIQWWWSRLLWNLSYKFWDPYANEYIPRKIVFTEYEKRGPRTGVTRDPYIYWVAACELTGMEWLIDMVKVPWWLSIHAPITKIWKRYLETGKGEALYLFLERKKHHDDEYVNLLSKYRRKAYEHKKAMK